MVEQLKPCGHCGNTGTGEFGDTLHVSHTQNDWHPNYDCYSVQCDKCTATMGYSASEDEAIAAWNTRAIETELLNALETYANGYLLDEFHNPALCYDDAHRAAVSKVFAAIAKARGLGGEG